MIESGDENMIDSFRILSNDITGSVKTDAVVRVVSQALWLSGPPSKQKSLVFWRRKPSPMWFTRTSILLYTSHNCPSKYEIKVRAHNEVTIDYGYKAVFLCWFQRCQENPYVDDLRTWDGDLHALINTRVCVWMRGGGDVSTWSWPACFTIILSIPVYAGGVER